MNAVLSSPPPVSIKLSPGGCCHGGRAERRVSHHHLEEREEKGGGWGPNEGLIGATFDPDMSMSRSGHLRKPADLWLFSRRLSFCCRQHVWLNTSLHQRAFLPLTCRCRNVQAQIFRHFANMQVSDSSTVITDLTRRHQMPSCD